jgi:hypothetical protein
VGGALESGDALVEGVNAVIQFRAHQTNNGDLQNDGLVGRTLHFSHRTPNGLEGAHRARKAVGLAPRGETLAVLTRDVGDVGRDALGARVGAAHLALELGQLADHEHFFGPRRHGISQPVEVELYVPALGCGLWLCEK